MTAPRFMRPWHPAAAACLAFFLIGQAFVPLLGFEDDETLFATPLLNPREWAYAFHLGPWHIPCMLMSYLGTLKTLLYQPVLGLLGTSVWAVREPALLAGAASIWFCALLAQRIAGWRAATVVSVLLAADSCYLLTACFDWGPVALQHLLLTAGLWLALRFYQERSEWSLRLAYFFFGLALWDKALAVWMLSGIGVAALAVFPRQVLRNAAPRRLAACLLALALGALPLMLYNIHTHLDTLRSNAQRDTTDIPGKARLLRNTLAGQALFGYLTAEDRDTPTPHVAVGAVDVASDQLAQLTGQPRHNLMVYGFALALVAAAFAGGAARRAVLFAVIAMAVAWIQMAITARAGGSVHHSILLWPLPALAIAVSWACASQRLGRAGVPALAAATAVLAVAGLLVTNEYYAQMARNGGSIAWTDAIFPLRDYVSAPQPGGAPWKALYCMDWGIRDNLRLASGGALPVRIGDLPISKNELTEADLQVLRQRIERSDDLFLTHTSETRFFPAHDRKLEELARSMGYTRRVLAVIPDSFGRRIFEVYRFAPTPASDQP